MKSAVANGKVGYNKGMKMTILIGLTEKVRFDKD